MKFNEWNEIAELIGIAAIVASLVFVGIQIRQEAEATRSAAVLQLKDAWVQINLARATSVELATAIALVNEQGWEADEKARPLVEGYFRTMFHMWSNAYYQYRIGTLAHEQWVPIIREIEAVVENDVIMKVWADWNHVFDDELRQLVNNVISARTADATRLQQEQ